MYTNEDTNLFLFDWAAMPTLLRLNNRNVDCADIVIDPGFTSDSQNDNIGQHFATHLGNHH